MAEATCASCGAALVPGAKFCFECGTPVAAAPEREVRKTVTLLFTDVTGSTAMGEALDPEAYRGVMGRYFAVAREAVERHGGTVEKFVGDAVLAVFGVPEVREDDALRAVRAADDLVRAVATLSAELADQLGVRLAIRTGVNTGSVVAGAARAGGSFATGDAVNTAARLEQAADPGQILLGADTYALVRDAVEAEPVAPVEAKGKAEPVPAYRLVSVSPDEPGRARRLDAPLVGRDRETRALDDALERTVSSGRSHLVTVVGGPGLGKTRLVSEFVERVGDRAEVVTGRCVSYGQGITYWPIVQALRAALRLRGGESAEVVRHAVESAMGGAGDTATAVDLLMPLLGAEGTPGSQDQTFWAVRRLLEQLALRRPLVLALDDLHWAEPTLLELLERVRDEVADLPLLLVCQARPELLEQHPDWGRGSLNSVTFDLEPFDVEQTRIRIEGILGTGAPVGLAHTIADWSGGNPLFVEEIVTHLVEIGRLRRSDDGWEVVGDLADAEVPPTVAALLAARLDRLPPDERAVLERVSVIGLEFTTAEALTVAETADAAVALGALARRDLLRRVRTAEAESWAFKHVLVREAAYDALPKALRADLHERFADALSAADSDAGAELSAFVAHHLEQALRLRRELAPHDAGLAGLTDRTAVALAEAADVARDREQTDVAQELLTRASELPVSAERLRRDLLVGLLQVLLDRISLPVGAAVLDRYAEALDDTATELDHAVLATLRLDARQMAAEDVDPARLEEVASGTLRLAREAGDARRAAIAHRGLISAWSTQARWAPIVETCRLMVRAGTGQDARLALLTLSVALLHGPAPLADLEAIADEALADPSASPSDRARALLARAVAVAGADRPEADELAARAYAEGDELGSWMAPHMVLALLTHVALARDDHGEAVRLLGECVARLRDAGLAGYLSTYVAWQGLMMHAHLGAPAEQVAPMFEEAAAITSPYDVVSIAMVTTGRALVAAAEGRHDEARALAGRAVAVIDGSDQSWLQAQVHEWLSLVPRAVGDPDEERRLLGVALERYRAKGLVRPARRLEARLAALA